jgi:hypothetical protein
MQQFSRLRAIKYCNENNDIEGIKRYISAYYAKIPDAKFVVKYCKTENKYEYNDSSVFKNNTLKPLEI